MTTHTTPDAELLPCPFDNGVARLIEQPKGYGLRSMHVIECSVCRVSKSWPDKDIVVEHWNTRTPSPSVERVLKAPKSVVHYDVTLTVKVPGNYNYITGTGPNLKMAYESALEKMEGKK